MRVLGLDPGLRHTGWGVVDSDGVHLRHVANGVLKTDTSLDVARRLVQLDEGILAVIEAHQPDEAAVEMTLANKNAQSTLKLGLARGVSLLTPARYGLPVAEYLPMIVKKAVVGTGHAAKEQVQMMVGRLLPGCKIAGADAADALAVAICHSHNVAIGRRWQAAGEAAEMAAVMAPPKKAARSGR